MSGLTGAREDFPPTPHYYIFPCAIPAPRTTTHYTRAPRSTALQPRSAQTKFILTVGKSRAVVRCSDVIGFPTLGSAAKEGKRNEKRKKDQKDLHGVRSRQAWSAWHYKREDNRC